MNSEGTPVAPKKIIWLASYPKSGNTWFRAFLTALLGDGDLDINEMKTDGIFSSRAIFDDATDMDSTYMYDDEVKTLLPEVFTDVAARYVQERLFVKVHDAYTLNLGGQPIIPLAPTLCALYFIRNPLDVAGSFANHNGGTIDAAIETMNNPRSALARQRGNFNVNNQFRQLMLSWSGHVESWTTDTPFPVLVVRYEDMLGNALQTFTEAVAFMGISPDEGKITKAIHESRFEKLKEQEDEKGFLEKNKKSGAFFRKGQAGNWVNELTAEQIRAIVSSHKTVMSLYNYAIP